MVQQGLSEALEHGLVLFCEHSQHSTVTYKSVALTGTPAIQSPDASTRRQTTRAFVKAGCVSRAPRLGESLQSHSAFKLRCPRRSRVLGTGDSHFHFALSTYSCVLCVGSKLASDFSLEPGLSSGLEHHCLLPTASCFLPCGREPRVNGGRPLAGEESSTMLGTS